MSGDRQTAQRTPPPGAAYGEITPPEPAAVPPEALGNRSRRASAPWRGEADQPSRLDAVRTDVIPHGQPMTSDPERGGAAEMPEPAAPPSAGDLCTEPLDQGAPLAGAGSDETGRGAGEPDGEQ